MELWNDALVATCEGQSRRRLSHPRLSANTAMLRTACFLCVIGHRELLAYAGQSPEVKQQIVDMAMNASGIRDTARVLHISPNTVLAELKKRHRRLSM